MDGVVSPDTTAAMEHVEGNEIMKSPDSNHANRRLNNSGQQQEAAAAASCRGSSPLPQLEALDLSKESAKMATSEISATSAASQRDTSIADDIQSRSFLPTAITMSNSYRSFGDSGLESLSPKRSTLMFSPPSFEHVECQHGQGYDSALGYGRDEEMIEISKEVKNAIATSNRVEEFLSPGSSTMSARYSNHGNSVPATPTGTFPTVDVSPSGSGTPKTGASPCVVLRYSDIRTGLKKKSLSTSFLEPESPNDVQLRNISQTLLRRGSEDDSDDPVAPSPFKKPDIPASSKTIRCVSFGNTETDVDDSQSENIMSLQNDVLWQGRMMDSQQNEISVTVCQGETEGTFNGGTETLPVSSAVESRKYQPEFFAAQLTNIGQTNCAGPTTRVGAREGESSSLPVKLLPSFDTFISRASHVTAVGPEQWQSSSCDPGHQNSRDWHHAAAGTCGMVASKTVPMETNTQHRNVAQNFSAYPDTAGFPPTDSFPQAIYADQGWVPSNMAVQDSSMAVQETNVTVCRSSMAVQGSGMAAQNMAVHMAQGSNMSIQDPNMSVQGSNMAVQVAELGMMHEYSGQPHVSDAIQPGLQQSVPIYQPAPETWISDREPLMSLGQMKLDISDSVPLQACNQGDYPAMYSTPKHAESHDPGLSYTQDSISPSVYRTTFCVDQTPKVSWQCPSSGLPGSNQDIPVLSLGSELNLATPRGKEQVPSPWTHPVMVYPSDGSGQFQHKNPSLQGCQQLQYEAMQAQNPANQCSGLSNERMSSEGMYRQQPSPQIHSGVMCSPPDRMQDSILPYQGNNPYPGNLEPSHPQYPGKSHVYGTNSDNMDVGHTEHLPNGLWQSNAGLGSNTQTSVHGAESVMTPFTIVTTAAAYLPSSTSLRGPCHIGGSPERQPREINVVNGQIMVSACIKEGAVVRQCWLPCQPLYNDPSISCDGPKLGGVAGLENTGHLLTAKQHGETVVETVTIRRKNRPRSRSVSTTLPNASDAGIKIPQHADSGEACRPTTCGAVTNASRHSTVRKNDNVALICNNNHDNGVQPDTNPRTRSANQDHVGSGVCSTKPSSSPWVPLDRNKLRFPPCGMPSQGIKGSRTNWTPVTQTSTDSADITTASGGKSPQFCSKGQVDGNNNSVQLASFAQNSISLIGDPQVANSKGLDHNPARNPKKELIRRQNADSQIDRNKLAMSIKRKAVAMETQSPDDSQNQATGSTSRNGPPPNKIAPSFFKIYGSSAQDTQGLSSPVQSPAPGLTFGPRMKYSESSYGNPATGFFSQNRAGQSPQGNFRTNQAGSLLLNSSRSVNLMNMSCSSSPREMYSNHGNHSSHAANTSVSLHDLTHSQHSADEAASSSAYQYQAQFVNFVQCRINSRSVPQSPMPPSSIVMLPATQSVSQLQLRTPTPLPFSPPPQDRGTQTVPVGSPLIVLPGYGTPTPSVPHVPMATSPAVEAQQQLPWIRPITPAPMGHLVQAVQPTPIYLQNTGVTPSPQLTFVPQAAPQVGNLATGVSQQFAFPSVVVSPVQPATQGSTDTLWSVNPATSSCGQGNVGK